MTEDNNNHSLNDVETRLSAYYGPKMPVQPLSSRAWDRLSQQLGPQHHPRQTGRMKWHGLRGVRRNGIRREGMPAFIHESLLRVCKEARWNQLTPPLLWTIRSNIHEPSLRIQSRLVFGKPALRVVLPIDAPIVLRNIEMDVLLASGLARFVLMNRLTSRIVHYAFACLLLLAGIALVYDGIRNQLYQGILIAIVLSVCVLLARSFHRRRHVFMADRMIVNWLGRSQVCEGLHGLVSRRPGKGRRHRLWWSEPSLEARIERVCGTKVPSRDRDLTLVG